MRLCVLTTSFPRHRDDEAGVFVKRLVEGYAAAGASGVVLVPQDQNEPRREELPLPGAEQGGPQAWCIERFNYGLIFRGRLAFGAGMLPNLRRNPFCALQLPLLALGFVLRGLRLRREYAALHANWIFTALAAYMVSRLVRKPYIVTVRGEDLRLLRSRWLRPLLLPALQRAGFVTTVSSAFREELAALAPRAEVRCIPNGVSVPDIPDEALDAFCAAQGLSSSARYLLFVGTIIPRKRIEILIRLLAAPVLHDCTLLLCGRTADGAYVSFLRETAAAAGCADRLDFRGAAPPGSIPYYLRLAALYVTASEFEGRPNAVLEALAAGCPVLASDIPAHREIIRHTETGMLFDPGDLTHAAQLARNCLDGPALRARLVAGGRALTAGLTWQRSAEQYLELFEQLAAPSHRPR